MPQSVPTCNNCHVPINLCHCSASCCSACGLKAPSANSCECVAKRANTSNAHVENAAREQREAAQAQQAKLEKQAQAHQAKLEKQISEIEKREAALKKMLAEEKVKSQSEREMRSKLEAQHAAKVAELERQLKEAPAAAAERVAELEKAAHLAINMEATAESKRKAAEATLANVREQLIDQKERTKRAEEAAQLANEAQRAQAAEVDEAEAGESRLKARLDEALKECGTLQADAAAASQLRMKLKEAEGQRDMAREEVGQLQSQNKERILAYEGAVADGRKHKTAAEKATEQCKKEAQRADAEQKRADSLAAERAQLEQSLAHAEKIRALFQSVTSRTNQVQEAANEVIATVEKRKKAEKATQQQQQQQQQAPSPPHAPSPQTPAESLASQPQILVVDQAAEAEPTPPKTAQNPMQPPPKSARATVSAGGDGVPRAREGWAAAPASARGPLQVKHAVQQARASEANVMAPQPPTGARKVGLAPGRQGMRSVFSARDD